MICGDFDIEKLIIPFLQDRLEEDQLEAFVAHIDTCPECYEELQISFSLYYGLQMLDEEQPQAVNLQKELERRLEEVRERIGRRKRVRKLLRILAVVLSVLLLLLMLYFVVDQYFPEEIAESILRILPG